MGSRPEVSLSSPDPRTFLIEPLLSIVTATHDRKQHLMKMVASARSSLRPDVPYEIVVVDGGSTDGTQEWCYKEPDTVLLQGDLSGAVPNFNAGFVAARGRYVCMANDDIEFVGDSLQLALDFMPNHPRVGAACIPQVRRPETEPFVSLMSVSVGGITKQWPMAQVAVVPKWLGDRLGWWGQTTAHYYGDQFLSRRIWENGFIISIVPDAWLRDERLRDDLRKRNDRLNRGRTDAASYKRVYPANPKVRATPVAPPPFDSRDPNRPDVDIVLGTYNRKALLRKCVESHRVAAKGLKHRFIVVDGGSSDGTLEWLRGQPDVTLLECGVLDGAVKAFNRGFARSTADYVVNANDDMTIAGSLVAARNYLVNNPGVGQLAFPKAGVGEDHTTHTCLDKLFANFGMTRRWLGNYVGWWGNWTQKYFGDVYCSLKIWELGYSVEVFHGCKCTDYLPDDALRGPGGGNVLCEQDSLLFDRRWPTKEKKRRYVRVPGKPVVEKGDFE